MSISQAQPVVADPVVALLDNAPTVEASAEELKAFEQGLVEIHAGQSIPAQVVQQRLATRSGARSSNNGRLSAPKLASEE